MKNRTVVTKDRLKKLQRYRSTGKKGGLSSKGKELQLGIKDGLADYLPLYLDYLAVRNYSEETIESQRQALCFFIEWAQERSLFTALQITKLILEAYQRHMHRYRKSNGNPLGISTRMSRTSHLKSYFKWLCRQDYLPHNPASELEMPREEKRLPEDPLSKEQIITILNTPDISDLLGLRDRAILETFYCTGIRRSELVRLQEQDFNRDRKTLQIRQGKGSKDRVVPICGNAFEWLIRYQDQVRPYLCLDPKEQNLFLSSYGQAFNPDAISKMVKRYIGKAKIGRTGSCHLFRHSCATHMLENGADIRFIQQLLGHAKLDTTQVYTHVSITQLQEIHARTHPRGKK